MAISDGLGTAQNGSAKARMDHDDGEDAGLPAASSETIPGEMEIQQDRIRDATVNGNAGLDNPQLLSPLPSPPTISSSAPPTSTLPTIPGGHSDEEPSSDSSSTHSRLEAHEPSTASSSTSEPTTALAKKDDVTQKPRSSSMKKTLSHDNVRRLSAAGMQQLTAPEALPIALVTERGSLERDRNDRLSVAEQLQSIRLSMLNQPDTLRPSDLAGGLATDGGFPWQSAGQRRPASSTTRTLSTPPTNRKQPQPQHSSPRRNSFHPAARPAPLDLEGSSHFASMIPRPIPQSRPSTDPSPPSPIPASIPLPPMSIPTHLQLELAAQRPSPLYIHHSYINDVPYESNAVKLERLMNVLVLPAYLERTLYFGALACLDAWLHNFTILPMRFCIALGVLFKWWAYLLAKEARWMVGYVWYGLGRLWLRGRGRRNQEPLPFAETKGVPSADTQDGNQSRAPEPTHEATAHATPVGVSTASPRDGIPSIRIEAETKVNGGTHATNQNQTHQPWQRAFRHRRTKSIPSALSQFHKADLLQGAIIIFSSMFLMHLDASRMYHFIRAQDFLKLYVIYNVLEVGDRLLSSLGQDIFECLFSSETLSRNSSGRSKVLLPLGMFLLALVYNVIHSVALYFQVITLNVAVNSYSNALLTLLMSNQFVEIKSTVFKRFEKDNLFQLTCADIVERFQLWIMLFIIGMRNVVEVGGLSVPGAGMESSDDMGASSTAPLHSPSILPHSFTVLPSWLWSGEVLSPFLIVIGSEMLVDTIKHAYVGKFNNIKPNFYGRILDILSKDYYTNAFVAPSLTRRLGLAVIPLSCLFIRASVQTYHMFLSTHVPAPIMQSTQTSLSVESATPSSTVVVAALDRLDILLRDALGRAVYGDPYGSPHYNKTRHWWDWTSDDVIAAVTMIVVFFIAFLVLLIIKLVLGMALLRYSRNRYKKMKRKEHLVATGQAERDSYLAKGKRSGGYGQVEVTDEKRRWIHADETEGLKGGKGRTPKPEKAPEGEYMGVYRYEMVTKRIW